MAHVEVGGKVEGHVQTPEGAQRAIYAGFFIIAHGRALTSDHHRQMAQKGIFLTGTDTPPPERVPLSDNDFASEQERDAIMEPWQVTGGDGRVLPQWLGSDIVFAPRRHRPEPLVPARAPELEPVAALT